MNSLLHTPIRPPRDGHDGEQVFAEQWQLYMRRSVPEGLPIDQVIVDYPWRVGILQTRILASVVTWFGTNCGQTFLNEGRHLAAKHIRYPYLAAWAITNHRKFAVNHGWRTLEHICAQTVDMRQAAPDLSSRDYELVEHFMRWMGGVAAQSFITNTERELEIRHLKLDHRSLDRLGVKREEYVP